MTEAQTDDWYLAGNVADFEDEDIEQLKVGNLAVAVYFAEGNFYATQDLCTHERAYLSDGILIDCIVECPFPPGPLRRAQRQSDERARLRSAQDLSAQDR